MLETETSAPVLDQETVIPQDERSVLEVGHEFVIDAIHEGFDLGLRVSKVLGSIRHRFFDPRPHTQITDGSRAIEEAAAASYTDVL